jgi:hypothetical protein
MARRLRRGPSREGLREYVLVMLFLALAVAGALILFGDEIRGALGLGAAAPPPPPPSEAS